MTWLSTNAALRLLSFDKAPMREAPPLTCVNIVIRISKLHLGSTYIKCLRSQILVQNMRQSGIVVGIPQDPAKVIAAVPPSCEETSRLPDILKWDASAT